MMLMLRERRRFGLLRGLRRQAATPRDVVHVPAAAAIHTPPAAPARLGTHTSARQRLRPLVIVAEREVDDEGHLAGEAWRLRRRFGTPCVSADALRRRSAAAAEVRCSCARALKL